MRRIQSLGPGFAVLTAAGLCVVAASVAVPAQEREVDIAPPPGGDEGPAFNEEGYEALTRGPMHEAFANPYVTDPEPGLVVEQQPPEPIDEVPPDQMPEGDNVVWIPGYWGWDPDGDEFLWISGLWRNVPSDRRWISGYWAEVEEGYQWISGFWASAETEQLAYLPEPPDSLEHGPNVAPPDGDYFWIPGSWTWQDTYEWRPGYWASAVADWVWVPDQYVWTPYGCVFVPGYWDSALIERGVMFAPVLFDPVVYRQPNFRYVPTVVIDTAPLLLHLFVSPTYSHYFYGDYYAFQPSRPGFGFYPWVAYDHRPTFYDPLLTYYQWSYAQRDINIVNRLTIWNQYFVRNEIHRPRRTFAAQRQFLARIDRENLPIQPTTLAFASPLQEFAETRADQFRFEQLDEPRRQRFAERAQAQRDFQQRRSEFEVAAVADEGTQAPTAEAQPGQPTRRPERTLDLPEAPQPETAPQTEAAPGDQAAPSEDAAPGRDRQPGARPEPPPRPQPGRQPRAGDEPGRDAVDRPRREPGDEPRPDRPGLTRPEDTPGRDQPGRDEPRPDRPGVDRPGVDRPGVDRPGVPGRPGETPARPRTDEPGVPRPNQPEADLPGRDRRSPEDRTRPDRPGAVRPDDEQGPQFPRFGIGRNRATDPGAAPGAQEPGAVRPGGAPGPGDRPQPRGRRGFDPFGGLPPGAEDRRPGLDRGQPGPGQPGAESRPRGRSGLQPRLPETGLRPGQPDTGLRPRQPDTGLRPSLPGAGGRDAGRPPGGRRAEPGAGGPGPGAAPRPRAPAPQPQAPAAEPAPPAGGQPPKDEKEKRKDG